MLRGITRGSVRLYVACFTLALVTAAGCIIVTTPLGVDAGLDIATTTGSTVLLQANPSGGSGQYRFIWSDVAGLSDPTAPNPTYLATTIGDHFLTVTVIDSSGDTASDTIRITVTSSRQPLVAEAGPNLRTAVNSAVTLEGSATGGSGVYTYSWSPAEGLSSANVAQPTFTPTAEGTTTFTLTVTDNEGLTATDTVEVTAYVATTLTSLMWAANSTVGYQLTATFSQPLTQASAEVAAAYRVNASGTASTSAVLGPDQQTVTLTFTTEPLSGSSTFDIGVATPIVDLAGNEIVDVSGRPAEVNPADTIAPTVVGRQWGVDFNGSYLVLVQFSEAMDRITTQAVSAYRLNGLVAPVSATLSGNGQVVSLVFSGVALSPTATLDIGVGDSIRDVNGLTLVQVTGQSIADNPADTVAPVVVQAIHAANFGFAGYRIDVVFSEAMSRSDVENPAGYSINAVAASSAELGSDGKTVAVTFQTPITSTDVITVGVGGLVKDINGNATVEVPRAVSQNGADLTSPTILSRIWGQNAANYQVHVTFNESMDRASATTTTHFSVAIPSGSANPTVASLDNTGKIVTLTFAATGSGLPSSTALTVSGNVLDINGRPNASTSAISIAADPGDVTGPSISSRVWAADATTYQAIVAFSEVVDRTSALVATSYIIGSLNPTAVALDTTGRIVTLTFGSTTAGFNSNATLEVSAGVLDVNGKANTSTAPTAMAPNLADITPPTMTAARINATTLDITFSEVMDKASVEAAAYTITGGNVTAAVLQANGRTVRVTTDVDPSTQTVTVPTSVQDVNGQSPAAPLTDALP